MNGPSCHKTLDGPVIIHNNYYFLGSLLYTSQVLFLPCIYVIARLHGSYSLFSPFAQCVWVSQQTIVLDFFALTVHLCDFACLLMMGGQTAVGQGVAAAIAVALVGGWLCFEPDHWSRRCLSQMPGYCVKITIRIYKILWCVDGLGIGLLVFELHVIPSNTHGFMRILT